MRNPLLRHWFGRVLALALAIPAPGLASELYFSGDIGISSMTGDGDGTNNIVGLSNSGTSKDASPVYGAALGVDFPLNRALPWRIRMPDFLGGDEDFRFPDWDVRFEVEYLRGRDFELATDSFNALEPYRAKVEAWSVMGKLRMDFPIRKPIHAIVGRVPFLDPLSIYVGGGAGMGFTDLDASTGLLFGSDSAEEFAWQANTGIAYELNERVTWSIGYRYYDLGKAETRLQDATGTDRGSYGLAMQAHEFTTSLSFAFWRVSFLGDE